MINNKTNLNACSIPCADGPDEKFANHNISKDNITVYFKNLEAHLVEHIQNADAVFGAIAWFTNKTIINELAKLNNVSIIVQKEDFLRPDCKPTNNWKNELRSRYCKLSLNLCRYEFTGTVLSEVCTSSSDSIESVRCMGNYNREKNPAFPRMHNKFLVFAKIKDFPIDSEYALQSIFPYAVWTGSFNLTENATNSLENALFISDPVIATTYLNEYSQIAAISEPLDWTSDWIEPEWRIGT